MPYLVVLQHWSYDVGICAGYPLLTPQASSVYQDQTLPVWSQTHHVCYPMDGQQLDHSYYLHNKNSKRVHTCLHVCVYISSDTVCMSHSTYTRRDLCVRMYDRMHACAQTAYIYVCMHACITTFTPQIKEASRLHFVRYVAQLPGLHTII